MGEAILNRRGSGYAKIIYDNYIATADFVFVSCKKILLLLPYP